ncbi:MAG TPA: GntR family transcriptional regulator [Vicinamibacterales bacterium]|nr:GntR family transcriptional regulator [Vicinamibacterales bacterium]
MRQAVRHLFHVTPGARIPVPVQLEEQIKVALALGKLRPGDVLPSIRTVEEELGVGRMLVRKAYQHLQEAGLVRIVHGRGAIVHGYPPANGRLARRAEALVQCILEDLRREGLDPVSFARMLHQRSLAEDAARPRILCVDSSDVLARELARQIEEALGVHVQAMGLARLRKARHTVARGTQVLVDYYYLADVRRLLAGRAAAIYPVAWDYDVEFIERLRSLPIGSAILLLFYASSLKEQGTQLAIEALLDRVKEREFAVDVKAVEQVGPLARLAKSRYAAVLVSNRVWDDHAATLERYPQVFWRLSSRLNRQSLDAIRDRLGFVI